MVTGKVEHLTVVVSTN